MLLTPGSERVNKIKGATPQFAHLKTNLQVT